MRDYEGTTLRYVLDLIGRTDLHYVDVNAFARAHQKAIEVDVEWKVGDLLLWAGNVHYPGQIALYIGDGNCLTWTHGGPRVFPFSRWPSMWPIYEYIGALDPHSLYQAGAGRPYVGGNMPTGGGVVTVYGGGAAGTPGQVRLPS